VTHEQLAWTVLGWAYVIANAMPWVLAAALVLGAFWLGRRRR